MFYQPRPNLKNTLIHLLDVKLKYGADIRVLIWENAWPAIGPKHVPDGMCTQAKTKAGREELHILQEIDDVM